MFFLSFSQGKKIVGIVKVVKEYYTDPTDLTQRFVAVDVAYEKDLKNPVSLEEIKKEKILQNLALIKQSRLSVMPIDTQSWKLIINLSK